MKFPDHFAFPVAQEPIVAYRSNDLIADLTETSLWERIKFCVFIMFKKKGAIKAFGQSQSPGVTMILDNSDIEEMAKALKLIKDLLSREKAFADPVFNMNTARLIAKETIEKVSKDGRLVFFLRRP